MRGKNLHLADSRLNRVPDVLFCLAHTHPGFPSECTCLHKVRVMLQDGLRQLLVFEDEADEPHVGEAELCLDGGVDPSEYRPKRFSPECRLLVMGPLGIKCESKRV